MSEDLSVVWLARHGGTGWSLTGSVQGTVRNTGLRPRVHQSLVAQSQDKNRDQ